jgi:hypothetical protein
MRQRRSGSWEEIPFEEARRLTNYAVRTNPDAAYGLVRDYSEYPRGTVSHSEDVPVLRCAGCGAYYDTDARRSYKGVVFYRNVNELIQWCEPLGDYYCQGTLCYTKKKK